VTLRAQAVQVLKQEVLSQFPPEQEVLALGPQEPLPAGSTVVARSSDQPEGEPFTLAAQAWFFFVDPLPTRKYRHPVLYVFIDVSTGAVSTRPEEYWPEVDGTRLYSTIQDRIESEDRVWPPPGTLPRLSRPPARLPARLGPSLQGDCAKQAFVIAASGDSYVKNDVESVSGALKNLGFDVTPVGPKDNLVDTINSIIQQSQNAGTEEILIYISGHGSTVGTNFDATDEDRSTRWNYKGQGGGSFPQTLEELCRQSKVKLNIIIDSCESGAAAEGFKQGMADSGGTGSLFAAAASGQSADGGSALGSIFGERSDYTAEFVDALQGLDCDTDDNGCVDYFEMQACKAAAHDIADGELTGQDPEFVIIEAGQVVDETNPTPSPSPSATPSPSPSPQEEVCWVTNGTSGTVAAFDAATTTPRSGSPFPTGGTSPVGVALDPVNHRVYVANFNSSNLTVLNSSTGAPVSGSPFSTGGSNSLKLAYDPANNRIYVSNFGSGDLSVFDAANLTLVGGSPLATGSNPVGVAYDPTNSRVYVANSGDDTLTALSAASLTPLAGSPFATGGANPQGVAYDPVHNRVYVVHVASANVAAFDASTMTLIDGSPFPTGLTSPGGVAYDAANNRIYVTGSEGLAVLDASSMSPVSGSPFSTGGSNPRSVAYSPVLNRIFVANSGSNDLTVFDAATLTPISGSPFPTGGNGPQGVAVGPP
jgi:YVTN family beta-propeller protein